MLKKTLSAFALMAAVSACKMGSDSELSADKVKGGCRLAPTCIQKGPAHPKAAGFKHNINKITSRLGKAIHRGRDVIAVEGAPIVIQGKFTYGLTDSDIIGENVDIYLSQGCRSGWKKIGSATTTVDGQHEAVDGVEDTGGRIYADISKFGIKKLPVGRHKVTLVLTGDNTTAELYVDVLPRDNKVVVSDIDGTLTTSEMAAASEVIGIQPKAHAYAPEMLQILYKRGYHIFYLTARPEWLMPNTRAWLRDKGFPPGSIHTTNSPIGAQGDSAVAYKTAEIKALKANTGIVPSFAFGNKPSDVTAFGDAGVPAKGSFFYKLEGEKKGEAGDAKGGTIHDAYSKLIPFVNSLQNVCKN